MNIIQFSAGPNGVRNVPPSTLLTPSHYWTFNEDDDVRWDYIGNAHAMPYAAPIPVVDTILGKGVRPNDGTSISADGLFLGGSRSFTIGVWAQTTGSNDDIIISAKNHRGLHVRINFTANTRFMFTVAGSPTSKDISYGAAAGSELKLYWISYDADTLTANVAINDSAWSSLALPGPLDIISELFFGTSGVNRGNGETTIAEAVVWDRYMPSQEERAHMHANWRGPEYFSNVSADPPPGPFTDVTLVDMEWLSDADLIAASQAPGTYFLNPYPLHAWAPEIAAEKGDYVWMRSTDHGAGGLYLGYSDSPAVPPTSWTLFVSGVGNGIETPDLTYHPDDPDGKPFYVASHIVDDALTVHITGTISTPAIYQTTVLHRSADLESWEPYGTILPNAPSYFPANERDMLNHTGYMAATPWGDGTWRAYSVLSDGQTASYTLNNALLQDGSRGPVTHPTGRSSKRGWWSSSNGRDWTLLGQLPILYGRSGFFSMDGQRYAVADTNNGNFNLARVFKLRNDGTIVYPGWPIESWLMADHGGVWIQGTRIFAEGDTAHIYIKHGFREPNGVIAYYTATLRGELDAL